MRVTVIMPDGSSTTYGKRPVPYTIEKRFFVCVDGQDFGCDVYTDFFQRMAPAIKEATRRNRENVRGRSDWQVWDQMMNRSAWKPNKSSVQLPNTAPSPQGAFYPGWDEAEQFGIVPKDIDLHRWCDANGFKAEVYTANPDDGSLYISPERGTVLDFRECDREYYLHPLSRLDEVTRLYYERIQERALDVDYEGEL